MKKILFMILVVMVALASCDVMPQISDIDGDGIADELDNLDDRLVGTWAHATWGNYIFNDNGTFTHPLNGTGTWETRIDSNSDGKFEIYMSTSPGSWADYELIDSNNTFVWDYGAGSQEADRQ
jgi:hypothetical protein